MNNYLKMALIGIILTATSCSDKKEAVVKGIKDFSNFELGTVEYVVEKVVAAEKGLKYKESELAFGDKKMLYSMTAHLKAGINMDAFNPEKDVIIKEDNSIILNLPKTQLLVLNIAPESIRLEFSKVSWYRSNFSERDKDEILSLGEKSISESIDEIGILKDAEKNAREYFESLFQKMGFKSITINFV